MTSKGPQHLTIGAGHVHDGLGGGGQQIFARMPRDRTGHGVVEAGDDLTGCGVPDRRAGRLALRQRLAVPPFMGRDTGAVRRHRITRSPDTAVALRLSKVLDGELVSELVLTLTGVDLDLLVSVFLHLLLVLRGVTIPRGREFLVPRPELVPPLLDLLACEAV